MTLRQDLESLPRWGFAFPGALRDELTALALAGTKTTTAGLFAEVEVEGEAVTEPGDLEILLFRGRLGDPTFVIDDDTYVVLQRFRVVERLDAG